MECRCLITTELNSEVRTLAYRVRVFVAMGSSGSNVEQVVHLILGLSFLAWSKSMILLNDIRYS